MPRHKKHCKCSNCHKRKKSETKVSYKMGRDYYYKPNIYKSNYKYSRGGNYTNIEDHPMCGGVPSMGLTPFTPYNPYTPRDPYDNQPHNPSQPPSQPPQPPTNPQNPGAISNGNSLTNVAETLYDNLENESDAQKAQEHITGVFGNHPSSFESLFTNTYDRIKNGVEQFNNKYDEYSQFTHGSGTKTGDTTGIGPNIGAGGGEGQPGGGINTDDGNTTWGGEFDEDLGFPDIEGLNIEELLL